MRIEVKLADSTSGYIIKNMYPLYLHDLSGIHGIKPNKHGIFEEDDIKTLSEQYNIQQIWFEHTGELFPYLIIVDDIPAGFCLIGSGKYVSKDVDYFIYEVFLLSVFRGKSIARKALHEILDKHSGKWMLFTHSTDNNQCAKSFWHKTIDTYTEGKYTANEQVIDDMPKLVFNFQTNKI